MAYTVTQSTTGTQGAADPLIYVVYDDTNTSEPKYRYVCSVQVNGSEVIKLKQLPNNNLATVFDVRSIAQAYVAQDENPYQLGMLTLDGSFDPTEIFAINSQALETFTLTFGYEYAASINDEPVVTLLPATDTDVKVINGTFQSGPANLPLSSSASASYQLSSSSRYFLSDIQAYGSSIRYPIADHDGIRSWAALAFLNGDDVGSTGSHYLHIAYYNGTTALNSGYIENSPANGGFTPAAGATDAQSLLYVGLGPMNLESQSIDTTLKPSNNSGYTHYNVQFASSTTLSGNETSKEYVFERIPCGKYWEAGSAYTLHWWNSKGGVDSLPCAGKSVMTQEMEKKDYRTSGGNSFNANGTSQNYIKRGTSGGKRSARVRTTTTLRLSIQSGSVDQYTPMMESLLNSERVYLSANSKWGIGQQVNTSGIMQCYVTKTDVEYLKGVNDGAATYTVTVELSRRRPNP